MVTVTWIITTASEIFPLLAIAPGAMLGRGFSIVTRACVLIVPVLGVAVPYAVGKVALTVLGPIVVAATFTG
ncbi:hypothetical protein QA649_24270 [Bradyrhizobium sp. CB1717]|uniref:hypothetical protein n=1 Tax=Bradyrhizobium sp. CB1717 TaxID=3039154 RepID=UPI0024B12A36|nr:hypothetical protein [Bradyrhizobium sp. CB1717]WFU21229.1 hypothetical protein QA649_24270 [Bradyrhizobium sp. CB1717]